MTELPIPGPFRRVVDLTHLLRPDFPSFDGVDHFTAEPLGPRDAHGFVGNRWRCTEHFGTHLDAPVHCAEGGRPVDRLALSELVVPAVVVDVRARVALDPDHALDLDDLAAWEARHGEIPPGSAVLMWSGWDARAGDGAAYRNCDERGVPHFPGFHRDAAAFLRDARRVVGLGVDTLSLDPGRSTTYEVHRAWLPHERWGLENLCNLDALPPTGALLVVGALRVVGGSGGPVRALALVP